MQAMLVLYLMTTTGFVSAPMNVAQYSDMASCRAAATNSLLLEKSPLANGPHPEAVFVCAPMSGIDVPDGPRLPK
jgi:hypothetical protein